MVENHTLECADISKVRIYYTKHVQIAECVIPKLLPPRKIDVKLAL